MKFVIILTVATIASGARLDTAYLPPNAGANSINTGLQTPFETESTNKNYATQSQNFNSLSQNFNSLSQNFGTSAQNYASQAEILRYENEIDDQGWHYAYETSDGTKAEQVGRVLPGPKPEEGSVAVSGSYSYVGDDGQTYSVTYTADETGYHPSGDHLPTSPPIPDEILKSLQLTAGGDGQYSSQKSSYDADAGY